jgi:hypothetical protein
MGWEPTTTYLYDEEGRLVSSQPEPEWDEVERAWVQGLHEYRSRQLCKSCGLPKSVCRAPETEDLVTAESERCHVSAAIARRRKADSEAEIPYPESLVYSIVPSRQLSMPSNESSL